MRQIGYAHQEHKRIHARSEVFPTHIALALGGVFMTRHHGKGSGHRAMGHGNARIGRHGNRRSNARHDFKGQIVFPQEQAFFTAPAKHKGVAAFEAHDAFTLFGLVHQ